jgi:hypothetical protein
MKLVLHFLFILVGLVQLSLGGEDISSFTLTRVDRRIDLTSQLSIVDVNATLSNTGSKPSSRVHLLLDSDKASTLAYIEARSAGQLLQVSKVEEQLKGNKYD